MPAELLLHYIWEHRLWQYGSLKTDDGARVEILDPGIHNLDAGPDFFNAKVKIGDRTWAGNVEIHTRASDWLRHGHQNDASYHSVILHVVGHSDTPVTRPDGTVIPQMELPYAPDFRARYDEMVGSKAPLACGNHLGDISPLYITDWLSSLGYQRLYSKADRIGQYLERLDGDWQEVAYVTLARALGFSVNAEPFERLAFSTPLRCLLKHRSDSRLVEATLFGQAGFLNIAPSGPEDILHLEELRLDYDFMKSKYDLEPIEGHTWKLARMRPPNFPHRRIAALMTMICDGFTFGRRFSHVNDEQSARNLFNINIGGYWETRYNFGGRTAIAPRAFSPDTVTSLIINTVVPLLYAYGLHFASDERMEAAINILQSLRAESNSVTRVFTDRGIRCDDAFTSQALIQLRREYCEPRKCLFCRLGHRILAAKAAP